MGWRLGTASGLNCMHTATSERPGAVPFLVLLPFRVGRSEDTALTTQTQTQTKKSLGNNKRL